MKRKGEAQQQTLNKFLKIKEYVSWKTKGTVLIGQNQSITPTTKIAGFDFDGTLACYKGAYQYPKDRNDWKWFDDTVPIVLTHLAAAGYTIVIFSNQKGILNSIKRKTTFQGRIEKTIQELEKYCKSLDITAPPILIMAATGDDSFRKPRTGMWYLLQSMYSDIELNTENSFYCGDAAGRDYVGPGAHFEDHADTDRKWAVNLNMDFYVPHQLFNLHCVEKYRESNQQLHTHDNPYLPPIEFDPRTFRNEFTLPELHSFDLIICVGPPAAGKSHFCSVHLKEFIHVNQDTLKTKEACLKSARKALDSGLKVIIDNTNPKVEVRKEYLSLAQGKRVACLWFKVPHELSFHNNAYREHGMILRALKESKEECQPGKHVPAVAIHSFWKYFKEPTIEEGFETVIEVPFSPMFPDSKEEAIWRQFYH
jgi:bifunctional polynucleotide phosphatase/kinase